MAMRVLAYMVNKDAVDPALAEKFGGNH
jgi:hypothetical protein